MYWEEAKMVFFPGTSDKMKQEVSLCIFLVTQFVGSFMKNVI